MGKWGNFEIPSEAGLATRELAHITGDSDLGTREIAHIGFRDFRISAFRNFEVGRWECDAYSRTSQLSP